jgi:enamine deaminase RidA (YjgF/YER057c/UK114 family)
MSAEKRIKELGIELPPPPKPGGNYVPAVRTGNLLYLSGCGPTKLDGSVVIGKLGASMTIEQGYDAARLTGLNMLANIRAALGSLDKVRKVVKTLGMVNAAPDFDSPPRVINGFSDLFVEVFGEANGRGARSAVGMVTLPNQMAVEVEIILEVDD